MDAKEGSKQNIQFYIRKLLGSKK